jgi:hypothetical protein
MYSKHIGCNYFCTVLFIKYYKPSALMKSNDLFLLRDGGANVYIYIYVYRVLMGEDTERQQKLCPFD